MSIAVHVALFSACFFWAISFIATKTALPVVPPLTLVFIRTVIGAVCFLLWMLCSRQKLQLKGKRWTLSIITLGIANALLHYGLQTTGLQYTTAANASLYATTGPLTILLFAAFFLGEKLSHRKILGMVLAFIGVLTVMGWKTLRAFEWNSHLLGDLLVFTSISMWSLFAVFNKRLLKVISAQEMSAWATWIGAVVLLPISLYESSQHHFLWSSITTQAWMAMIFLGVTCTFLATLLYLMAQAKTESQKAGVYLYTIPPMTYFFSAFFLHEAITMNLLIGSALVLAGVMLTELG